MKTPHITLTGQLHTSSGAAGFIKSKQGRHTREYRAYRDMLNRCYRPSHNRYHRYGGRGITVCERWLGGSGFDNFVFDMGLCPDKYSLDRERNDESYHPRNCRWASASQQALNRHTTRRIVFNGRERAISELAKDFNLPYETLERRLNKLGWDVSKAVLTPVRGRAQ